MNEVCRQEKKYWMNLAEMKRLAGALAPVMLQDKHNGAQGYRIRSLYFDTVNERDYEEKLNGIEMRRKLRLRLYDPAADFAMLEIKQKQGPYQKKRSLRLERADAEQLARGRYDSLLRYNEPVAAEIYALLQMYCYRPKTIVEYRRFAFIARENQIRVTFDHDIRSTEAHLDPFDPMLDLYPVVDQFNGVLEVKYNGFLLGYIKEQVNRANRSELTVSKYCLARSAGLRFGI